MMRFLQTFAALALPVITPLASTTVLLPTPVQAQFQTQGAATLVADQITIPAGSQQLIAYGNVEIFFDGTRMSAQSITFDQTSDRLTIEGVEKRHSTRSAIGFEPTAATGRKSN